MRNFLKIRSGNWLTGNQLEDLSNRAARLFVYAEAMCRFITDHSGRDREEKLERLLSLTSERALLNIRLTLEGTTLCSLYMSALQEAFGNYKPEDCEKIRSLLGAIILAQNPITPSTIAMLLNLDVKVVRRCLESVESVLILKGGNNDAVKPFHGSFPAFLTDPALCTDKRFYVPPFTHHKNFFIGCLELKRKLKENRRKFPDAATDSGVNGALKYVYTSWYKHLYGMVSDGRT